ncbi:hypothetical protein CBE37_02595 [bacterium TMED277]|nr:MAG: hypothetical protein CBE37_02595 [bacterium TMED277]
MAVAFTGCEEFIQLVGSENDEPIEAKSFQKNLHNIQVGDLLWVKLEQRKNNNLTAKIVRKIKLSRRMVLGVYFHDKNGSFVSSTTRKDPKPYPIEPLKHSSVINGKYGYFEIRKSKKNSRKFKIFDFHLFGSITDVSSYSRIATIQWKIRDQFPKKVIEEAILITKNKNEENKEKYLRKNFITIDPHDAKDLDDAIFVEEDQDSKNKDGFIVYIAIADVSYFVNLGSEIDLEAKKRGNSTYFPDKVIPMLPEVISNEICSLKTGSFKRCIVAKITIDKNGNKLSHSFQRNFIKIANNFSYRQFNQFLEISFAENNEYAVYKRAYKILKRSMLLKNRLLLNFSEKKIEIGRKNFEVKIFEKKQLKSNELIELLMILANTSVAELLRTKSVNSISRIHPTPDDLAINELNILLQSFNWKKIRKESISSKEMNKILLVIEGSDNSYYLKQKLLGLLPKAVYSQGKANHFGLHLKSYCHFTSPIRRYADLTVHRALSFALGWEKNYYPLNETLRLICDTINLTERQSVQAERDSVDRYSALFMANQKSISYEANIIGASRFFVFVRLKLYPIEGVIPKNEFFKNKLKNLARQDTKTLNELGGQRVEVKLNSASPHNGTIYFSL